MSDMIFGTIWLVIFLVVVFVIGYFFYKFKNSRLTKAWGPLVDLVNGKVVGDGGGGATSWLEGTYKDRKVQASMVPDRNMYSSSSGDSSGPKYNYFAVSLAGVTGKHDWNVNYNRKLLGMGQEGWRVQSPDPSVQAALDAAGVVSFVAPYGEPPNHFNLPTLDFNRREGLLRYQFDSGSSWTPSPQLFTEQLEMLLRVADINKQVNPA